MTRPFAAALAVALALPALARAQGNPLARPPAWVGAFADATVRIDLHPTEAGFDGSIAVKGTAYRAKGQVTTTPAAATLEGTFSAGGKDYAFSVAMEGTDTAILASAGTTYRLARVIDPPKSTDATPPGTQARPARGPDLTHVRAGQKYIYSLQGGQMQMTFLVREVGPGLVRYDMQTFMDMGQGLQPVGEAVRQEFRQGQVVTPPAGEGEDEVEGEPGAPDGLVPSGGKTHRERITVSGVAFDCLVTEMEQTTTWTPMTGDVVTFPLYLPT
jgi:hypothetical protein